MGLEFEPRRTQYSSLGKPDTEIIRDPESRSVEQLISENQRLQLLLVELLIKNECLRTRLQDAERHLAGIGSIEIVVR
jgi:hypothetical protein